MKKVIFFFLVFSFHFLGAQVKLVTWNVENFGRSKSAATLLYMSQLLKEYDVVALQEVVAGPGGAQAVAKLVDALNRSGSKWDYTISDPTSGRPNQSERYAFLWKTAVVKKKGKAWLEQKYHVEMEREPYCCTFTHQGKPFTLVSFHAVTKRAQPEREIKYLKFFPGLYPSNRLIFLGDFNCPASHSVFSGLKKIGFTQVFTHQKTSLKKACVQGTCLASEFDNIWYSSAHVSVTQSQAIHFYTSFTTLKAARRVSDHIPLTTTLYLR